MTIAVYCQHSPPLPGIHLWSLRDAQRYFKEHPESIGGPISHATIHRILLTMHYVLTVGNITFRLPIRISFQRMEHIIGHYSNPPQNLYCFDECTCIQALKRFTPTLPPAGDQPALEDFDYHRNGTTDLLAFLNPATGKLYGQCTENHNRHTLCQVFSAHVEMHPSDAVIHYIMDNLSAHYHNDFVGLWPNSAEYLIHLLKPGSNVAMASIAPQADCCSFCAFSCILVEYGRDMVWYPQKKVSKIRSVFLC